MTVFLRLLSEENKLEALRTACQDFRNDDFGLSSFEISPNSFRTVPGAPFAYWVSARVRECFSEFSSLESGDCAARVGLQTSDDFRFIRLWWEISEDSRFWVPHAKGGRQSYYYSDIDLVVRWSNDGREIKNFSDIKSGKIISYVRSEEYYFRPGLTWTKSTTSAVSFRCMPKGAIFGVSGLGFFIDDDEDENLLSKLALMNSAPFRFLLSLSLGLAAEGRKHYEAGIINKNPCPDECGRTLEVLGKLAKESHDLKRSVDSTNEISHAFLVPSPLRTKLGLCDIKEIEVDLSRLQAQIDNKAFELYGFSEADRKAAIGQVTSSESIELSEDDEESEGEAQPIDALLSWAIGVAFGRFDWRLATGEREVIHEPGPFDPLPPKSPGMLPDGAEPFHKHLGILVDDPGHPHDLSRLIEEVLERVDVPVPGDVCRWLQRDFFAFHLQRYSKSRRKSPIYWPLSTNSGSYTLWLYYPSMTSQMLYTAINDFVDPKLKQVGEDTTVLRNKGAARSREDEKQFETLQAFELELLEFRDILLKIAQNYHPNQDDGVQITAAPLWPLFRHKPWQKVLKDTWAKLEKGEYDWAHLAMNYWPDRVRDKCKTDKSLAIAHGLEELYIEPEDKPKKTRGKKAGV